MKETPVNLALKHGTGRRAAKAAPELAMVTLSLNASTFYFGVALGFFVGSLMLPRGVGLLAWLELVAARGARGAAIRAAGELLRRVAEEDPA
jgi:predicted MFS family arabinose efflux permease